jgi:hypothetical protein
MRFAQKIVASHVKLPAGERKPNQYFYEMRNLTHTTTQREDFKCKLSNLIEMVKFKLVKFVWEEIWQTFLVELTLQPKATAQRKRNKSGPHASQKFTEFGKFKLPPQ